MSDSKMPDYEHGERRYPRNDPTYLDQVLREAARRLELNGMTYGEMREQDIKCDACGEPLYGDIDTFNGYPHHVPCIMDIVNNRIDRDDG
jgi:hypothetical protein